MNFGYGSIRTERPLGDANAGGLLSGLGVLGITFYRITLALCDRADISFREDIKILNFSFRAFGDVGFAFVGTEPYKYNQLSAQLNHFREFSAFMKF